MYDLKNHLDKDEKILYEDRPTPGKGDKSIGGCIFIVLFMALMQGLLIWSVVTGTGDGANGINLSFIIIFAVTLLFDAIAIYNIMYLSFFKKKSVSDDYYCLTNKRAFKYESKKDKLVYGYLVNYEDMRCLNIKDGYGDVYMGIIMKESNSPETDLAMVKDIMFNPNPQNMPMINFESVSKPNEVLKIAKLARDELLKSNNE